MENKPNNSIYYLLPGSVLLLALIFYISNHQKNDASDTSPNNPNTSVETNNYSTGNSSEASTNTSDINTETDNSNNSVVDNATTQVATIITINNRCRGCGRCAQIDSEHFTMSGREASVVSNSNLSSSKLQTAINMCPENAISLE